MKNAQRLDFAGLAEVLGQRELVEVERLHLALQTGLQGSSPFPELLVNDGLMGDWELSRVVCELYSLPFVPVDIYTPSIEALEGLDHDFLRKHRLVPVGRHGQLLTVAMPGLVPADVLGMLSATADLHVMPVVGSVMTNNRWLEDNLVVEVEPVLPGDAGVEDGSWSNIFDEGDASVLMDLTPEGIDAAALEVSLEAPLEALDDTPGEAQSFMPPPLELPHTLDGTQVESEDPGLTS